MNVNPFWSFAVVVVVVLVVPDYCSSKDLRYSRPEFGNVYLLGERNSGTTFAASVVGRIPDSENISAHSSAKAPAQATRNIPVIGFKHMFRGTLLNESELQTVRETSNKGALWLLVVRNPCDWMDGMYRIPWYICNPLDKISGGCQPDPKRFYGHGVNRAAVLNMTRLEFMKTSWVDAAQWFQQHKHAPKKYRTRTPDWSTATYSNIFELRTFKLRLMLQIMEAVPHNFKVVHLDQLELSTDRFLRSIHVEFNVTREGTASARARPHLRVLCLSDEERQVAHAHLDWDVESKFGFTPSDCHTCINSEPPPSSSSSNLWSSLQLCSHLCREGHVNQQTQSTQQLHMATR
eukprot:m.150236 g.150236  ORF g.150236 m.150236 type:complete len:348 (+) comp30715_c2_seq4:176-1219(+)